jgi:AraC-like DNA-binding protein
MPTNPPSTARAPSARGAQDDAALQTLLRVAELATVVDRHAPGNGLHETLVPGLALYRSGGSGPPAHSLHRPAFCLIVQGSKRVMLADELYTYDASTYLVVTQPLPVMSQLAHVTVETPYLSLRLEFEPAELAACMQQCIIDRPAEVPNEPSGRGLFVGAVDATLLDPVLRMVRLLDTPHDIAILAPLAIREIAYRLLTAPEGWRLAQPLRGGSAAQRIGTAIAWLREHAMEPLRLDELAERAHMSPSSLHHHFKAVTAMSPLQYQKRLRLYEARRLLLGGELDAASAAYRVGYQSPSQFSREYARLFGAPPLRDLREWRAARSGQEA